MKGYESKSVVCPMYRKEYRDRRSICCEGFSALTRVHTFFASADEMKKHKQCYCCSMPGYENCPVYRMADAKYEGKLS